jgi:organic radical activating enzyme
MSKTRAKVNDIFLSIQGEGKYLGQEQCFIRFYGCNLNCGFCDTKLYSFKEYNCDELGDAVKEVIGQSGIKTISLTGGEPLLERNFLLEFLPKLKKEGFRIYLESNGVLYNELFDLIDNIDIISMDIKLPSSTKDRPFWREHEEFLKVAKPKDLFVKLVICLETTLDDLKQAVNLVSKIDPKMTFILQPNSGQLGVGLATKMNEFKKYAKEYLLDVRAIPQIHKAIGVK